MNPTKFARIAESLRQYRRADLKDFDEIGSSPIDKVYVDPLPSEGVLNSVVSTNTTFLLGRKGTGKSTVFARAQSRIRETKNVIAVYIDVKKLYEVMASEDVVVEQVEEVDAGTLRAHSLRKHFLRTVLSELLKELTSILDSQTFVDRIFRLKRNHADLKRRVSQLQKRVLENALVGSELPILQKISRKWKTQAQQELQRTGKVSVAGEMSAMGVKGKGEASLSDFDKTLEDQETYNEYSDVVVRVLPFQELLTELQELLDACDMARLVVFFDDYSELKFLDQKLFVDIILAPLNNSSNDRVKLKVAGYPGRVYYGKIDPSKVDTLCLDFSALYAANEVQTMEAAAVDYAERLIRARFAAFSEPIEQYFDHAAHKEYFKLIFQTTANVPRLMGALLHTCYLDRIARGQLITPTALRLAAQKYYENTVAQYFDLNNRFALEPFENKLDRHNQKGLLNAILAEARRVRKGIQDGKIGGSYFVGLTNPPVSHFTVSSQLEGVFSSLEANFLLTKYKDTRDKNGNPVIVYAFYHGLTESERMSWGYPDGREYRNYFVQRCFDYSEVVRTFLVEKQTIRCNVCGRNFPLEQRESFSLYKWKCPECGEGICAVVNIRDDFAQEVAKMDTKTMLEEVELRILTVLHEEGRKMRSGEISSLLDLTYQLIGKRTSKLQTLDLVKKEREDDRTVNTITPKAVEIYFAGLGKTKVSE